jgi:hypothetical protein
VKGQNNLWQQNAFLITFSKLLGFRNLKEMLFALFRLVNVFWSYILGHYFGMILQYFGMKIYYDF